MRSGDGLIEAPCAVHLMILARIIHKLSLQARDHPRRTELCGLGACPSMVRIAPQYSDRLLVHYFLNSSSHFIQRTEAFDAL